MGVVVSKIGDPTYGIFVKPSVRKRKIVSVEVEGELFEVEIVEVPFREGVELRCVVGGEEIRVGDRGLGESEALRLMRLEIQKLLDSSG